MASNEAGSYVPESLADPQGELARLRRQAEMFRSLEVDVLTKSGLEKQDKVVELGCGPGFVSKLLAELASEGQLVSIDNNPELLKLYPQQVVNPPRHGARALEASVDALPVEDGWADFVYGRFLFQHVRNPERGIGEAYRIAAPGAQCCLVDSDDGLVLHYPPEPMIDELLREAEAAQAAYGGDRLIGRKLAMMMSEAGFRKVRARVIALTSSDIPFAALFGILFGFKSALLGKGAQAKELHDRLSGAAAAGRFFLSAGIFVAVGEK
jgi:ubiquinone/menaquinone biosynthesis C-methylase UbiE